MSAENNNPEKWKIRIFKILGYLLIFFVIISFISVLIILIIMKRLSFVSILIPLLFTIPFLALGIIDIRIAERLKHKELSTLSEVVVTIINCFAIIITVIITVILIFLACLFIVNPVINGI